MKKFLIVLCLLTTSVVCFADEKKEEKVDLRSVAVDAWLVQVSADALYESGVKPLSEKDKDNTSVMNLLWCLSNSAKGAVIVSAKTRAKVFERVRNEFKNKIYLGEETDSFPGGCNSEPVRTKRWLAYKETVEFQTDSRILENKQVYIDWYFRSEFIYGNFKKNQSPPNTGTVFLKMELQFLPANLLLSHRYKSAMTCFSLF